MSNSEMIASAPLSTRTSAQTTSCEHNLHVHRSISGFPAVFLRTALVAGLGCFPINLIFQRGARSELSKLALLLTMLGGEKATAMLGADCLRSGEFCTELLAAVDLAARAGSLALLASCLLLWGFCGAVQELSLVAVDL